ncbi:hypothetical protein A2Y85_07990 [candidate division WOR-3 bacterium RBG_13_43_14]|uniref:Uncharacterized protein n=1 Tax=candidate division WOR-3 bacterium RBG_13_43_14 TaxID=1802590 RepID=A0A1F4U1R6_UNCW3|nr:MAG: hypothetical protein A2Y85_07990 [candidate division WOR-3 bacterium RBG_13_43_14]
MKFPKGRPLLENTRLEFINLDNVLSAAKRERAHKISGYISIIYPEVVELIFLKQGEPFNAARISPKERKIIPISEVIEKAKSATSGILSEYATDEILINLIISSIMIQPIKANVDFSRLQPKIFIDKLKSTQFNGFIWVKAGVDESFIHFEQGQITGSFMAGTAKKMEDNDIIAFLMKPNLKISIFDHIEDTSLIQATPAQVDMFCKIFTSLLKSYAQPIGDGLVLKTFLISKSTVQKEFPFVEEFKIESDLKLAGKIVVEPKLFAQGMARWFDLLYESFSTFLGKESEIIAKKVLNDYRFALKSLNFFDYTKLKI